VSMGLTIPSDRTQTILRWGTCFAVVLLAHALAVARLLEHSDLADAPPGSEVVELDLALGDPQEQIDPIQYTPPKPIQQDVKPQQEPEQKEAEVALPKLVETPELPTPIVPTPSQVEQEAKAPPKVSSDVVRKWQMTVNTRLNQFKRYPSEARTRHHEGRVIVAFTLDSGGHVVSSKIVKSSGSALLDQETLDLISRAQPYPIPPNGAGGQDLFLQVPIAYGLR
jgi:periplasmic protein TonB